MHFTVVFSGDEGRDLSFGLVFISSPCWVRGDDTIVNLNPLAPRLEPGSVRRLFEATKIGAEVARAGNRCTMVVHAGGHGGVEDLARVMHELKTAEMHAEIVDRTA